MPVLKNRRSWVQVIRNGVPEFVVMKPMLWNGALLEMGQRFPKDETHSTRLRQMYAAHRITPAEVATVEAEPVQVPKKRGKRNG